MVPEPSKEEPMPRFRVYLAQSVDGYSADENGGKASTTASLK